MFLRELLRDTMTRNIQLECNVQREEDPTHVACAIVDDLETIIPSPNIVEIDAQIHRGGHLVLRMQFDDSGVNVVPHASDHFQSCVHLRNCRISTTLRYYSQGDLLGCSCADEDECERGCVGAWENQLQDGY